MNETPDAEAAVLGNRSPVVIDGVPCSGTSYRISRCGERAVRLGSRSQEINATHIREESDCLSVHNPQDHYNLQVSFYSTSLLYFRLWNGRIQIEEGVIVGSSRVNTPNTFPVRNRLSAGANRVLLQLVAEDTGDLPESELLEKVVS